jgi:hypothetical protein
MIKELISETISRIEATEARDRGRKIDDKLRFDHAVRYILIELWKSVKTLPTSEVSINKRSGYYSENKRYRDNLLTFRQVIAAYDGLLAIGFIEVAKEGYYERETGEGEITRIVAKEELLERLLELEGHPGITVPNDLNKETILLRDNVNGKRALIDYSDTHITERYRDNLKKINTCFSKHWFDLEVLDAEIAKLEKRISNHETKEPIDFSKRSLVRIFSKGSFKKGGRFYRGWWQNVPREYRQYITIDGKKTGEGDFSQLNPHMLYFANNKELGSEDAYCRVLAGEHRDIVKQAFNAMVQASSPLTNCPNDIDLTELDMSWAELRDRIIKAHKPISHEFFKGVGNNLQFEDSCVAESVMLHFAEMDAPALPVHDSFILHHGYCESGEVEEAMRRAFYERFESDIPVKQELIDWTYRKQKSEDVNFSPIDIDTLLKADDDVSQWKKRHQEWYARGSD